MNASRKGESRFGRPTFTCDRIDAEWQDMEITIWNRLTIHEHHEVGHGLHESTHSVLAGDGSTGERPEFITPEMDDKLHALNIYPNARVIDPSDDEVTVL